VVLSAYLRLLIFFLAVLIQTCDSFSLAFHMMLFLEFPCSFYDPADVGNLTSVSSAFSKCSLYIWKFSVHVLLKSSLKDFEHCLASM